MPRFDRQVAVITGAAGGLGQALSAGFAKEGCRLFLSDLRMAPLNEQVERLRSEGAEVCADVCDLSDRNQTVSLIHRAREVFGGIDILVNNAAVCEAKSFWSIEESDWDRVLNVNVKGLFFALQAAANQMRERGGSIINIASVAGRVARPALLHYAASKAAVISITRSAALALAKHRIRVNAIAPGMIDTEMLQGLQTNWSQNWDTPPPSADSVPLGRVAQPEDFVATALFLAGSESAYMTGQTINVCGGIVMS